ncbi:hypothetical protein [Methylococcus mesophilus]|uniref:hypothetical protein n=1 Tax=Methylococcus mesophilus TaxID=2993564 RepID=UPI00224B870B|nr:hypothetical protein [Methylococcus mesophilus]UZR27456.1 hypothetical protein OOT43_12000 [Methylococcus mesophilus]
MDDEGEIKDEMKAAMFTLAQHMPELCAISVWRINGVTCIEIVCEGEVKRVQYMRGRDAETQARTH